MTPEQQVDIADVIVFLSSEVPATNEVLRAIGLLDRVLPPSGTPERRAAFAAAHERRIAIAR